MYLKNKKLINDISNLISVLKEFCERAEQTEEINIINSIAECIEEKSEQLYMNLYI